MIDTLSELVPILEDARTIRSFWGVRPLYEPPGTGTTDPTDITRDFFLLDHDDRDGVSGMASIVGGKFTTYRAMGEEIADHVCAKLGVRASCATAEESLPGSENLARLEDAMDDFGLRSPVARRSKQRLGSRSQAVLETDEPNPVICQCEGVTRAEIQDAIAQSGSDLNAVRIRTRASMGNCQGGFCCQNMANELHPTYDEETTRAALNELFQERWKGERHALWGQQLSQAMLNYALHATTMNRDRDPAGRPGDAQPNRDAQPSEDALEYAAFDGGA